MKAAKIVFSGIFLLTQTALAQPFFESARQEMAGLPTGIPKGLSVGDYNNDGWLDMLLSGNGAGGCCGVGPLVVYRSLAGRDFAATAVISPDPEPLYRGSGALLADYDNDGDLDVTEAAGLIDELPTDNAIWLDYDRDGHLDLYTGNLGASEIRNLLYRNRGDGTFVDVTAEAGLDIQFHSDNGGTNGGMAASDFNNDGWPDFYLSVWGGSNFLLLNREGVFEEATPSDFKVFGIS